MKTFDVRHRDLNIYQHHILEASAGTGKTFSIENLVVRLLIEKPPTGSEPCLISQILVVTFTRAATRELKERIRSNIEKALTLLFTDEPDAPDYILAIREGPASEKQAAKRRLETAAANYDEAQIFTLHRFCARMLRECQGGVQSIAGAEDKGLSKVTVLQLIKDFFRTEVTADQCSAGQLSRLLGKYKNDAEALQSKLLGVIQGSTSIVTVPTFSDYLERFQEVMCILKQHWTGEMILDQYLEERSGFKAVKGVNEEQVLASVQRFAAIVAKEKCSADDLDQLIQDDLLIAKRFIERKAKYTAPLSELMTFLQDRLEPIISAARDPNRVFVWMAAGCQKLLKNYIEQEDIAGADQLLNQMATAVNDETFRKRVSSRYRFAIVDEFQDTDMQQWRILQRLFLHDETLSTFLALVGDPKQAIYAFRQADIYTYMDAVNSFSEESHASLNTNFRSCTPLIEAVNHLFSGENNPNLLAMPAQASSLTYRQVQPSPKASPCSIPDGRGALHIFIGKGEKGRAKNWPTEGIEESIVLPYVANEISRLAQIGRHYRDVAILVRNHTEAARMLDFLQHCGLPAILERSGFVTDSPAFTALADLLHAALHPWDQSAVIQLIGGQLLRFTEEQTRTWLADPVGIAKIHRLGNGLRQHGVSYFIEEFLQATLTPTGCSVIEGLLAQEGGAELYRDLRHIAELLAESQPHHAEGLLEALVELRLLATDDDDRVKIRSDGKQDAVRILTIHASKGLEYPIVFATGLSKRSKGEETLIPVGRQDPQLVLADEAPDALNAYLSEVDAEQVRLAYVAMTRAKERLYLPLLLPTDKTDLTLGQASPMELLIAGLGQQWKGRGEFYKLIVDLSEQHLIDFLKARVPAESITCEVLTDSVPLSVIPTPKVSVLLTPPPRVVVPGAEVRIESFTSIAAHSDDEDAVTAPEGAPRDFEARIKNVHTLPAGADLGVLIHFIMEKLSFSLLLQIDSPAQLVPHIRDWILATPFVKWTDVIAELIFATLKTPLQLGNCEVPLCTIDSGSQIKEMEFLFPMDNGTGFLKGFIDFAFFHNDRYYLIDWKTNWLGHSQDCYRQEALQQAMHRHQYDLQARIYADAFSRYLNISEGIFGGVFYLFLRGLSQESHFRSSSACPQAFLNSSGILSWNPMEAALCLG